MPDNRPRGYHAAPASEFWELGPPHTDCWQCVSFSLCPFKGLCEREVAHRRAKTIWEMFIA